MCLILQSWLLADALAASEVKEARQQREHAFLLPADDGKCIAGQIAVVFGIPSWRNWFWMLDFLFCSSAVVVFCIFAFQYIQVVATDSRMKCDFFSKKQGQTDM